MRKQLLDQVNDLQKQLKNERDDNKQLRKRYVGYVIDITCLDWLIMAME